MLGPLFASGNLGDGAHPLLTPGGKKEYLPLCSLTHPILFKENEGMDLHLSNVCTRSN